MVLCDVVMLFILRFGLFYVSVLEGFYRVFVRTLMLFYLVFVRRVCSFSCVTSACTGAAGETLSHIYIIINMDFP